MKPIIQVCGDPTVDWLSVRNPEGMERSGISAWLTDVDVPTLGLGSQAGGSALLLSLIREMAGEAAEVQGPSIDPKLMDEPVCDGITRSWTIWQAYAEKDKEKADQKRAVFRLSEWQGSEQGLWAYEKNRLTGPAGLLVIEDSGIGFRDNADGWPECLAGGEPPECILLKLSKYAPSDCSGNPLLDTLGSPTLGPRTTVVTALADLRACPVIVGESLSWEKLMKEIVDAVYSPLCPFFNPATGKLRFARVIVTVGTGGAVIVDNTGDALVFDRAGQEGDFTGRYKGDVMGYNTCVMGALASEWLIHRQKPDWDAAARCGVALARWLEAEGYEAVPPEKEKPKRRWLQFPFRGVHEQYKKRQEYQADRKNEIWNLGVYRTGTESWQKTQERSIWSILEETVKAGAKNGGESGLAFAVAERARDIVIHGPLKALPDIPIETVGNWRSADRQEIEGVRSVNNAIRSYMAERNPGTPLCVAVFGPPGAGKSFAVKEVARSLGIAKECQLTFNLSQFTSTDELAQAFHQIRDMNLKGNRPLVFWDEFDTPFADKQLGWLKYFLAPMQDGEFTDHGRTHPVGGGIYVFAGATWSSFREFCDGESEAEKAAKKPDFISRLKAYIDVKGPNGSPNTVEDHLYIIRRAFLLNHFLGLYAGCTKGSDGFQIERAALDAFLRVNRYRHGARSMETLVKMSSVSGKRKYELSSLPPEQILGMHVNTRDFLSLTRYGHKEILRIGITGHIGLNPDQLALIERGVGMAIKFIERCYPNRVLTVFSPLALGADRLVTRILLQQVEDAGLIAVLPLPADEYVNDFGASDDHRPDYYTGAEMRQEFRFWLVEWALEAIERPRAATRDEAYRETGHFVAEHCDVLIAVWDGNAAQGIGGTGEVVNHAMEFKKPIVHIWAGNWKDVEAKRTDVGERVGTVRHKNMNGAAGDWEDLEANGG